MAGSAATPSGPPDREPERTAEHAHDDESATAVVWQPATSKPGELLTVEGQIRAYGALAAGLTNDDPRLEPYRRSMWRTGLAFAGLGIVLAVVAGVVAELL